jgi:hypothetical protein
MADSYPTSLKRCVRCSRELPLDQFYSDARASDGLRSHCRSCHAAEVRAYRLRFPDRGVAFVDAFCEQCGQPFRARACERRQGRGRFCSRSCKVLASRQTGAVVFARNSNHGGDGCWLWTGHKDAYGYGVIDCADTKNTKAHRFSWEKNVGPIPAGLYVLHHCDTPACTRPDHLFLGTHSDNMRDAASKGRLDQQVNPLRRRAALSILSPADVRAIRSEIALGVKQIDLARRYGVTKHAIWRIVHNLNWVDVEAQS